MKFWWGMKLRCEKSQNLKLAVPFAADLNLLPLIFNNENTSCKIIYQIIGVLISSIHTYIHTCGSHSIGGCLCIILYTRYR